MGRAFERRTLENLATVEEVDVETRRPGGPLHRVTIWVVVVGADVYVRSVRGARGRWYRELRAKGDGALRVGRARLAVRAVRDEATIDAVSLAFLQKYRETPYARSMVARPTLPTTLRLARYSPRR